MTTVEALSFVKNPKEYISMQTQPQPSHTGFRNCSENLRQGRSLTVLFSSAGHKCLNFLSPPPHPYPLSHTPLGPQTIFSHRAGMNHENDSSWFSFIGNTCWKNHNNNSSNNTTTTTTTTTNTDTAGPKSVFCAVCSFCVLYTLSLNHTLTQQPCDSTVNPL